MLEDLGLSTLALIGAVISAILLLRISVLHIYFHSSGDFGLNMVLFSVFQRFVSLLPFFFG